MGSPLSEMATCLGFCASRNFSGSAFGLPPYPVMRRRWPRTDSRNSSYGSSSILCSVSECGYLQQYVQARLQVSTLGAICMQPWLSMP